MENSVDHFEESLEDICHCRQFSVSLR